MGSFSISSKGWFFVGIAVLIGVAVLTQTGWIADDRADLIIGTILGAIGGVIGGVGITRQPGP